MTTLHYGLKHLVMKLSKIINMKIREIKYAIARDLEFETRNISHVNQIKRQFYEFSTFEISVRRIVTLQNRKCGEMRKQLF